MKPWLAALALFAAPALFVAKSWAAEPCKTAGSPDAKMVAALPVDADAGFNKAMAAATQPETVEAAVKAAKSACRRGIVSGENTDAFPRILKPNSTPPLDVAFLYPVTFKHGGKTVTWYAVVTSFGSGAVLLSGLFDGLPADDRASQALQPLNNGGFEPLEFDAKTGKLVDKNNYLPTQLKMAELKYKPATK